MQERKMKMHWKFTQKGFESRVNKMVEVRKEMSNKDIDSLHVQFMPGNSKTGRSCYTVSLLPVIDCSHNCSYCKFGCYDLRNDLFRDSVLECRCINSLIHQHDQKRYWSEIDTQIKANCAELLRINVGGDLNDTDFEYVARLGRKNKMTQIMFFTKNYKGINHFLDHHRFPKNVHPIMSAWEGLQMDNPHHLPESHVLYKDGNTTAPEYGAYYCGGNCTECHFNSEGCWNLKKNEHVIFNAH
jgi:hypothetical protein